MSKKIQFLLISILVGVLIFSVIYFFYRDKFNLDKVGNVSESSVLIKLSREIITGDKVFLVLFQNNMELRPGGGFIGSFAIIKTQNGKITSYEIHDTSNFDGRIPENTDMPLPMKKIFKIDSWKFRDSNYSPDFPTNAKKALDFYYQGQGEEKFDGVFAINAAVLEKVLEVTGPIKLEDYPSTFESKTALVTLEKQVEIDFGLQGIDREDRKDVMSEFLDELLKKSAELSKLDKVKLAKNLISELENKNIQLYFNNKKLNDLVLKTNWNGIVDKDWNNDYLMVVDANIGAYKSDYFIKRSMQYQVDMSKEIPEATLKITYQHTGKTKDWMTRDYLSYLRVYLPKGSMISSASDVGEINYSEDLDKKVMGGFVEVPLNTTKTIEIKYSLPKELKNKAYQLKIQKQSGSGIVPTVVNVTTASGENKNFNLILNGDTIINK